MGVFAWIFVLSLLGIAYAWWKKNPRPSMGYEQLNPPSDPWGLFQSICILVLIISCFLYLGTLDYSSKMKSLEKARQYVLDEESVDLEDIEIHISGCHATQRHGRRFSSCKTWRGYVDVTLEDGTVVHKELLMSPSDAGYINADSQQELPRRTEAEGEPETSALPENSPDLSRDPAEEYVIPPHMR